MLVLGLVVNDLGMILLGAVLARCVIYRKDRKR